METSAKASINVEEAFYTLARDIKAKMEKKLVRISDKEYSWITCWWKDSQYCSKPFFVFSLSFNASSIDPSVGNVAGNAFANL